MDAFWFVVIWVCFIAMIAAFFWKPRGGKGSCNHALGVARIEGETQIVYASYGVRVGILFNFCPICGKELDR